jgi:hypothetical protein
MSDRVLFISKTCEHSSKLLVGLHKHQLLNQFRVIDVGNIPREQIPPYVQSVPCLVHGNNMIKGEKLFEYLNMFAQEMLSKGNNGATQQAGQQAGQQGGQQAAQQAMGQREERVERMNMPQQSGQQQQPGQQQQEDSGDFEGWCDDGGCSIGFSMISESNDDHQNNKSQQNDFMFYLDGNESLTGSLNPGGQEAVQSGSTNDDFQKSAKRSEMDQAYEKMMENRR